MLITAAKIHNGKGWMPEGTVIELSEDGVVVAINSTGSEEAIFYDGVLAPCFVNTHCHLELSHMKGMIPEHTGLIPFLQTVVKGRGGFTEEQKSLARNIAFKEMLANGIIAIGDIANTADTLELRGTGLMHFNTFVESIGFSENTQRQFDHAASVYDQFAAQPVQDKLLKQSIVPHAPYSVSHSLFSLIDKHNPPAVLSIHNQESKSEDEYYLIKQGEVRLLLDTLGINDDFFMPSGKSSLQTYIEWLSDKHSFIFVHNTYTTRNDVQIAKALLPSVYWCLCPNANLYIENTLPDIRMFIEEDAILCIGTDGLSSNHTLNIMAELATIKTAFPEVDWAQLLKWATYNGAVALHMDAVIGSIEVGKVPGIINIPDIDATLPVVARIA